MTTTLITGGNRGLGFETARQLIALGHTVIIGARTESAGAEAAKKLGAQSIQLDVTDAASIEAAAKKLTTLDVLINNAGISGGMIPVTDVTVDTLRTVYETNVFGPMQMIRAMLPLLRKSSNPVIVNVGSGLGSISTVLDENRIESKVPGLAYCVIEERAGDAHHSIREGPARHAGQRGRPRLHRDRIQQLQRAADHSRRHRDHREDGDD